MASIEPPVLAERPPSAPQSAQHPQATGPPRPAQARSVVRSHSPPALSVRLCRCPCTLLRPGRAVPGTGSAQPAHQSACLERRRWRTVRRTARRNRHSRHRKRDTAARSRSVRYGTCSSRSTRAGQALFFLIELRVSYTEMGNRSSRGQAMDEDARGSR